METLVQVKPYSVDTSSLVTERNHSVCISYDQFTCAQVYIDNTAHRAQINEFHRD